MYTKTLLKMTHSSPSDCSQQISGGDAPTCVYSVWSIHLNFPFRGKTSNIEFLGTHFVAGWMFSLIFIKACRTSSPCTLPLAADGGKTTQNAVERAKRGSAIRIMNMEPPYVCYTTKYTITSDLHATPPRGTHASKRSSLHFSDFIRLSPANVGKKMVLNPGAIWCGEESFLFLSFSHPPLV